MKAVTKGGRKGEGKRKNGGRFSLTGLRTESEFNFLFGRRCPDSTFVLNRQKYRFLPKIRFFSKIRFSQIFRILNFEYSFILQWFSLFRRERCVRRNDKISIILYVQCSQMAKSTIIFYVLTKAKSDFIQNLFSPTRNEFAN